MDFTEHIRAARPNIKDTSVKAYNTSLKLLAPTDATDLIFLNDSNTVIAQLEKYKNTTKRNYLNAVIVVLQGVEGGEHALKEYERLRDQYNDEYSEHVQTHKKSERQHASTLILTTF